jgi:hypothetical protein
VDADFLLSIFDSEYLRFGKRNTLRDATLFYSIEKMVKNHNNEFMTLTELHEYLFEERFVIELDKPIEVVRIIRKCYMLLRLYGYVK